MAQDKKKKKRQVQKLKHVLTLEDLGEYLKETKKTLVIPVKVIEEAMMQVADNIMEKYKKEGKVKRVLNKKIERNKSGITTTVDFETLEGVYMSADVTFPFIYGTIKLAEAKQKPTKYFVLGGES